MQMVMRSLRAKLFSRNLEVRFWPQHVRVARCCLSRNPPILPGLFSANQAFTSTLTTMSIQAIAPSPTPIKIHIAPPLQRYTVPLHSFLARNPNYSCLVCSAFIFAPPHSYSTPSSSQPRLLLLQRSATDVAFPGLWEVPGGSADDDDPTILHSLAREAFEETGLRLTRVVRQVGGGIEWTEEKKDVEGSLATRKWLKLTFEIEVAEVGHSPSAVGNDHGVVEDYLRSVPVELDPEEHQDHAWVTEEEVRSFLEEGKGRVVVSREQAEKMLRAFEVRRMGLEEMMEEEGRVERYY